MESNEFHNIKKKIYFLWGGVFLGFSVSIILGFSNSFNEYNDCFKLLLLLLVIPVGIAYTTLALEVLNIFRYWLLLFIPLLYFFRLAIFLLFLLPLAYLVYITFVFFRYKKFNV